MITINVNWVTSASTPKWAPTDMRILDKEPLFSRNYNLITYFCKFYHFLDWIIGDGLLSDMCFNMTEHFSQGL